MSIKSFLSWIGIIRSEQPKDWLTLSLTRYITDEDIKKDEEFSKKRHQLVLREISRYRYSDLQELNSEEMDLISKKIVKMFEISVKMYPETEFYAEEILEIFYVIVNRRKDFGPKFMNLFNKKWRVFRKLSGDFLKSWQRAFNILLAPSWKEILLRDKEKGVDVFTAYG